MEFWAAIIILKNSKKMKKTHFILIICLMVINFSCNDYLDVVPDNVATIDFAFYDRIGAEKFLATCYSYLPNFGSPGFDIAIQGSDELCIIEKKVYILVLVI